MMAMMREFAQQRHQGERRIDGNQADRVAMRKEMNQEASRTQTAIMTQFKSDRSKFGGRREDNFQSKLRDYIKVCNNNIFHAEHDDDVRLRFFYAVFTGEAKEFYYTSVDPVARTFGEAVEMMKQEYVNDTTRERCHADLDKMSLTEVISSQSLSVPPALAYMRDRIVTLNSLGPDDRRTETHRRDYMVNAMKGHTWATNTLSLCKTQKWDLNQLYQQLDSDWQLHREVQQKRNEMRGKSTHPRVYYEGQGTYGKPRHPGSRSSAPGSEHRNGRFGQQARWTGARQGQAPSSFQGKCFNCGESGHRVRNCRKPKRDILKNCNSEINSGAKASQVLFEVARQMEDDPMEIQYEGELQGEEESDADDFKTLYEKHTRSLATEVTPSSEQEAIGGSARDNFEEDYAGAETESDDDLEIYHQNDQSLGF